MSSLMPESGFQMLKYVHCSYVYAFLPVESGPTRNLQEEFCKNANTLLGSRKTRFRLSKTGDETGEHNTRYSSSVWKTHMHANVHLSNTQRCTNGPLQVFCYLKIKRLEKAHRYHMHIKELKRN